MASLVAVLSEGTQQNHHFTLNLPHHSPHVPRCALQGALCCYVGLVVLVALQHMYIIIRGASLINESGRVNAYVNEAGIDV